MINNNGSKKRFEISRHSPRKNGFSCPWQGYQIATYILIVINIGSFFLVDIDKDQKLMFAIIDVVIGALTIITFFAVSIINPEDQDVIA